MTENEFLQFSDTLFAYIEDVIDEQGWAFDCHISGNVLAIEAEDGTQIIINRHTPNQELWIAAKSGGFHFSYQDGEWRATRDNSQFFDVLSQVLSEACQQDILIHKN